MKSIITKLGFTLFIFLSFVISTQTVHAQWQDPLCAYKNNCNGIVRVIRNSGAGTFFDDYGRQSVTLQQGDSNVGAAIYFWNTTSSTSTGTKATFQLRSQGSTQYQIVGTISGSVGYKQESVTVNVPAGMTLRFNRGSGCIIRNNGNAQEPCRSTNVDVSGSGEDLTIQIGTVDPDPAGRRFVDQGQVSLVYEVVQQAPQRTCAELGQMGTYPPDCYTQQQDVCLNLSGIQTRVPDGYVLSGVNCVPVQTNPCVANPLAPGCSAPQQTVYMCNDGIDNDRDGRIDSQDLDCYDALGNYNIFSIEYRPNGGTPTPTPQPQPQQGCPTGTILRGNVCTPEGVNTQPQGVRMSISTLLPTAVTQSEAELPGQLVNRSGEKATCWIEYGTSTRLGAMTQIQDCGNQSVIQFRNTIVQLRPGVRYYYRAVASNSYGIIRGAVRSFRTNTNTATPVIQDQSDEINTVVRTTRPAARPTVIVQNATPAPRTTTTITRTIEQPQAQVQSQFINGGSSLAAVSVESDGKDFCPGNAQQIAFRVKNIANQTLVNGLAQVQLPEGVEFRRATRGSYSSSSNSISITIPSLAPQEEVVTYIQVDITDGVLSSDDVVVNANYTYTNPATGAQEDAPNYLMGDASSCKDSNGTANGGALALFGGSFFPSTLLGWLILIFIVLLLVLVARRVLASYKKIY
jgi:hypothetical protein